MTKSILNLGLIAALVLSITAPGLAKSPKPQDEAVQKQIAILQSNAPEKEKADACRALAQLGTKNAIAPLAALLADEKMSHMARYALEPIPSGDVDKALRAALKQVKGRTLAGVIGSLGVRQDAKAVKPLSALLNDADPQVAQAAARALGSIGSSGAVRALLKALATATQVNQLAICEGLLRAAEVARANELRSRATKIYDALRSEGNPHQVRSAALKGAILVRQGEGIPLLVEAIRGADFAQFDAAMRIAQELKLPEVTGVLTKELPTLSVDKQIVLIQTLGQRGDIRALPALFAAAKSGDKKVRLAALAALPAIGDASAGPVLVGLLSDPDKDIAKEAQENLGALPGREVDKLVMEMLEMRDAERRTIGLDLAARRRMVDAVPAIFRATTAPQPEVRVVALRRLGELASPKDIPALLDLLASAKSPEDLDATEQALGAVCAKATNPETCADQLMSRLGQSQPAQKCALLRILTAVGGAKALGAVRTAVRDSAPEVRTAAIRALSNWSTVDAAPDLLSLARSTGSPADKMVCLRGYLGMAKRSDVKDEQRLRMCREAAQLVEKAEEQRLLLATLGDISSTEAAAVIEPYLEGEAKEEAANAIVGIAERLLKRNNAAQFAPGLIGPLEKVSRATGNAGLAERAGKLLEQAKAKAGGGK